jgi:hypothetical protein
MKTGFDSEREMNSPFLFFSRRLWKTFTKTAIEAFRPIRTRWKSAPWHETWFPLCLNEEN